MNTGKKDPIPLFLSSITLDSGRVGGASVSKHLMYGRPSGVLPKHVAVTPSRGQGSPHAQVTLGGCEKTQLVKLMVMN